MVQEIGFVLSVVLLAMLQKSLDRAIFFTHFYTKGLTVGASFSAVDIQKFDKVVQKV